MFISNKQLRDTWVKGSDRRDPVQYSIKFIIHRPHDDLQALAKELF